MKLGGRTFITVLSLWSAFSFVSLLSSSYVLQVDYVAYEYGFPFTWLVHQVDGLFPVNLWTFLWYPALLDFSFWFTISLAIGTALSKIRMHFFWGIIPIVFSIPFITILGFDPFLTAVGLSILCFGLVATVLEWGERQTNHDPPEIISEKAVF